MHPDVSMAASEDSHIVTGFSVKACENLPIACFVVILFFFPKSAYCFSILRDSNCWSNTSLEQALASVNTEQNETQFMPLQATFFVVVRSDLCLVFKQSNIAKYNVRWFSSWKGQQGHTSPSATRLSSSAWWLLRFLSSSTNSRHILNYWHKKVSSHNNISSRVLHFVNLVSFSSPLKKCILAFYFIWMTSILNSMLFWAVSSITASFLLTPYVMVCIISCLTFFFSMRKHHSTIPSKNFWALKLLVNGFLQLMHRK